MNFKTKLFLSVAIILVGCGGSNDKANVKKTSSSIKSFEKDLNTPTEKGVRI